MYTLSGEARYGILYIPDTGFLTRSSPVTLLKPGMPFFIYFFIKYRENRIETDSVSIRVLFFLFFIFLPESKSAPVT